MTFKISGSSFLAVFFFILLGGNIAFAKSETPNTHISINRNDSGDTTPATTAKTAANSSIEAIVEREARANGVPVALARAVVRIESGWNPRMTGSAGEVGLMQIKAPTARGMGYRGTRKALYEPATNIRWGMRYLAGAYRLADGDTCGTVMRYQGGHGATRMSGAARTYCAKARTIMASN